MTDEQWKALDHTGILITGVTGLIGSVVVRYLLRAQKERELTIRIYGLARSEARVRAVYSEAEIQQIRILYGDVEQPLQVTEQIGYILHGANPTGSRYFIEHPVETIRTALRGTENLLEFAKSRNVRGFVFLSSMEIYGLPEKGHRVTESDRGAFDPTGIRNCYPMSKQLCENLVCAYAAEYGVPAKILRLTQTFGPGVVYDDGRVFAEFARCAIEGRPIVLKTKGETERCYLHTEDAADAALTVLTAGKAGEAYHAANESTYCSILQMAQMVAGRYGTSVEVREQDTSSLGYAGTLYMDLDTAKLQSLGWKATKGLPEMYDDMIASMRSEAR